MCFRITSQPPAAVRASWSPSKQAAYAQFEQEAQAIATRHGLTIGALADALFLFYDLKPLFGWSAAQDFMPLLCTIHGTGR